jgi:Alanine-zipper, major outer membrane lipoprotein
MSTTGTLRVGLTIAAALFTLSACQSVTKDDLARVEDEVASLRTQVDAANAKAADAQTAASQCTQTCQETQEKTQRMYEQSLRK